VSLAERFFSADQVARARSYHRPLYAYGLLRFAVPSTWLTILTFTGVGAWLAGPFDALPRWAYAATFAGAVIVSGAVVTLPLGLWRHRYERRWAFSTQGVGGFLNDVAKAVVVSVVIAGVVFAGFVSLAATMPSTWVWVAAPAAAVVTVVLSFVAPVVLEPVFNRFRPLPDEGLSAGIRDLSVRAGVPVKEVLVADASRRTTKHSAYVSGLGATRRVVVFDTLLKDGSDRDVLLVAAHELGHRRDRHVLIGTVAGAASAALGVIALWVLLGWDALLRAAGVAGPEDPLAFPLILLAGSVAGLVTAPLGSAFTRRLERAADRAALELTGDREGFVEMMTKLAVANLSDLDPPRPVYLWWFSHPTPPERIASAT
jgi:STE24 endopeptidase